MKKTTPLRAIRAKCLDCCCWQPKEVRLCTSVECPLWLYRMGKRPTDFPNDELVDEASSFEKNGASTQFFTEEGDADGIVTTEENE